MRANTCSVVPSKFPLFSERFFEMFAAFLDTEFYFRLRFVLTGDVVGLAHKERSSMRFTLIQTILMEAYLSLRRLGSSSPAKGY